MLTTVFILDFCSIFFFLRLFRFLFLMIFFMRRLSQLSSIDASAREILAPLLSLLLTHCSPIFVIGLTIIVC